MSVSLRRRLRAAVAAVAVMALGMALGMADIAHAQEAEAVRDTASARIVAAVVIGLVVLGVVLAVVTVWFWRTTRPDHPVLLRLEVLGGRRARRSSPTERGALLDAAGGRAVRSAARTDEPVP